jgi:hypothetical protein
MKKAKVSSQAPEVAQPKVTIKLRLGPRPPELQPFPCCLCVSRSRDDLLFVHDKPILQHQAFAETKVWMAHESCARVLPETWMDEVEAGPVLEDGTRKREKMVFGVDAIVKDRWNLVSDVDLRKRFGPLIRLMFEEMCSMSQDPLEDAWRAYPVYEG